MAKEEDKDKNQSWKRGNCVSPYSSQSTSVGSPSSSTSQTLSPHGASTLSPHGACSHIVYDDDQNTPETELRNRLVEEKQVFVKYGRFDFKSKGEAVVCVPSEREGLAKRNLLDRADMNGRYIEVFLINRTEVLAILCGADSKGGKGAGKGLGSGLGTGSSSTKGKGKDRKGGAKRRGNATEGLFTDEAEGLTAASFSKEQIEEWNNYCEQAWAEHMRDPANLSNMTSEQQKFYQDYLDYYYGF